MENKSTLFTHTLNIHGTYLFAYFTQVIIINKLPRNLNEILQDNKKVLAFVNKGYR